MTWGDAISTPLVLGDWSAIDARTPSVDWKPHVIHPMTNHSTSSTQIIVKHRPVQLRGDSHQTAMSAREGRPVTRAEAHSDFSSNAGNRRVETQHQPSERLGGRLPMTLDEARALSNAACTIVDGRELCINGCDRVQVTASNPLCQACNTKKNKHKKEEAGARICAEVGRKLLEIVG